MNRNIRSLLLLLLLSSTASFALTVTPEAVQAALGEATLVADIDVVELESVSDPVYFSVSEAKAVVQSIHSYQRDHLPLPQRHDLISIRLLGGERNGVGAIYSGFPRLYAGNRYTVYLKRSTQGAYEIAGWEFGVVPHQSGARNFTRNRTDGSNGDGTGPFLYWDDSAFPIPFYISAPTFTRLSNFVDGIDASFRTWRAPDNVKLEFLPAGCTSSTRNENDGINNVILVTKDWPFDSSAIAITRNFYVSGTGARAGMILDSDIVLNGVNHTFTTNGGATKHDIQNIVTHEVGHFIGLGHEGAPTDSDATMFAVASPNETKKRTLAASDSAGLRAGYLGIGEKIDTGNFRSCEVSDRAPSCAAVHAPTTRAPQSLWLLVLYVLIVCWIGRMVMARRQ